jgi:hypothetical protein
MGIETATYISQLVDTNPLESDPVSQGDNHLRLIKSVLQSQFTTLGAAAVTTTAAELNLLDGKTAVGDVAGPGSSTDNAIARFDGTGGKTLQNSSTTIDDNGDIVVGGTTPTITIGDGGAEDAALVFDGNAKDFYVALDDTADKLLIGEGSTVGTNPILTITDDTVTLGDGAAVDTSVVFDGNAKDFYVALDDSEDKLLIGEGSTVGTNPILTMTDDTVTIGDGATVDTYLNFDGNAADYRVGIDDGTDKLEIGHGVAHGTDIAMAIDSSANTAFGDKVVSTPVIKDYAETVYAGGNSGTSTTLDETNGNVQTFTMNGNCTFTMPSGSGLQAGTSMTLILTQDGTGSRTGAFTNVKWAGGTAPTLTTTATSGIDILTFYTFNGGSSPVWYGFTAGLAMA